MTKKTITITSIKELLRVPKKKRDKYINEIIDIYKQIKRVVK